MKQSIGKTVSLFIAVAFVSGCASQAASPIQDAAEAAYQLGNLDLHEMNYEGAGHYYQQAVELKPGDVLYLDAAGFVAREKGEYKKAESLCRQALVLREKTLAPDHPDIAQSLNNLALVYSAQGQQEKAEPLYRRKQAILEKTHDNNSFSKSSL